LTPQILSRSERFEIANANSPENKSGKITLAFGDVTSCGSIDRTRLHHACQRPM